MKRICFTRRELDTLLSLIAIAGANDPEKGDYATWTDEDWQAMETLRSKAAELLRLRKESA